VVDAVLIVTQNWNLECLAIAGYWVVVVLLLVLVVVLGSSIEYWVGRRVRAARVSTINTSIHTPTTRRVVVLLLVVLH